jgi:NAD(P)-dependent dehydrogenase (short-subunit alcohol dehydrogenase family)
MAQMSETNEHTASSSLINGPLNGAAALVTGGSRGIGRAIALRLAQLGARVAICGRERSALDETLAILHGAGAPAHAQTADVTDAGQIAALVAASESAIGPISILVNNAGVGLFGPLLEQSDANWDTVLDTNLKSVFLVSRAVAPGMIKRRRGDIINISSLAGLNAFAGGALYCASKWGLQGLSACLAEDLRAFGVRVSTVCPGSVATNFSGRDAHQKPHALPAEDVAHAVATIVTQSPSSFISQLQIRPLHKA